MSAIPLTIAIDGTFASGKGTLSKRVAEHYGVPVLDTGKLYRAVARDVLAAGGALDDAVFASDIASRIDAESLGDAYLKSGEIGSSASKVSVHPEVRAALLDYQRSFAKNGAVLDGRDIGTVILPGATVKIFVDAEPEVRAERRFRELSSYGEDVTLDGVLEALRERDHRDMNRSVAPLKPAEDAHLLDTSNLSIDTAVAVAIQLIDAVVTAKG